MKVIMQLLVVLFLAALLAGSALAQELMIYPSQGQSQDQMEKDKFACYQWAKQQTGFDPMQAPQASQPPPQQEAKQGGVVRGAARGAAVGTVVGGIAGGECQKVSPETVNVPRFVRLNFEEKQIQAPRPGGAVRTTTIERMEHVDGKLILQGAEDGVEGVRDGLGWTMAIAEDTGKMVLTASGDEVGFVVFGACTPQ